MDVEGNKLTYLMACGRPPSTLICLSLCGGARGELGFRCGHIVVLPVCSEDKIFDVKQYLSLGCLGLKIKLRGAITYKNCRCQAAGPCKQNCTTASTTAIEHPWISSGEAVLSHSELLFPANHLTDQLQHISGTAGFRYIGASN
jgi:hypothetical protein